MDQVNSGSHPSSGEASRKINIILHEALSILSFMRKNAKFGSLGASGFSLFPNSQTASSFMGNSASAASTNTFTWQDVYLSPEIDDRDIYLQRCANLFIWAGDHSNVLGVDATVPSNTMDPLSPAAQEDSSDLPDDVPGTLT
jgi:hypothetical protein